tara:strand:- start:22 stop:177 length:156 start_codon:yes stop_codon:yes gene_type:complete
LSNPVNVGESAPNPLNYYEKTFELKPWQANLLKVVFIVLVVVLVVFLIFKG